MITPNFTQRLKNMSNLDIYPLLYTHDLLSRYQSFHHLPGFALLESSDHTRGRYDILSAYPYDHIKIFRDEENVCDAFQLLQSNLPQIQSSCDLPFQGGAIGYLSYDLGAQLAGIDSPPQPALKDMPVMDLHFYDWAIVVDHQHKEVKLIVANQRPETTDLVGEIRKRWDQPSFIDQQFSVLKEFMPLINKTQYQEAFTAIHQDLRRGRAYQVNYTQSFIAQFKGASWEMYKRVRQKNPVPFSAYLQFEQAEIISFSPERYLLHDNGYLLTAPIKGSMKRSDNHEEDEKLRACLQSSSKNCAENTMIVDLMRNDLGKVAIPGSVHVKTLCDVQSFNAVHHLVSDIEAQRMTNICPVEAIAACFPGGSITGAPKREAMRIISEHEPFARGVYCGSIGYFSNHGRFDSNIAIRTVTACDDMLHLAAGGGIVIDSTWEEEYEECYTKIKAILAQI